MSLTARIEAVMARVAVEVPAVTYALGWRDDGAQAAPPRIDWRPTRHGPEKAFQGGSRADGFTRAIVGRAQTWELRLWGDNVAAVETLFDALVRALEAEAAGAWSYVGGDWARTGAMTCGEAMTCAVTLGAHTFAATPALVTFTRAALSAPTSTPGDGLLEPGEP